MLWPSLARGRGLRIPHEFHRAIRNRVAGGVASCRLGLSSVSAKLRYGATSSHISGMAWTSKHVPIQRAEKFPIKNPLAGDFHQALSLQVEIKRFNPMTPTCWPCQCIRPGAFAASDCTKISAVVFSRLGVGPGPLLYSNRCFALVTPVRLYALKGHGHANCSRPAAKPSFQLHTRFLEGAFAVSLDGQRSNCQSLRHGCWARFANIGSYILLSLGHLEFGHVLVQPRPPNIFFIDANFWIFLAVVNLYGHAANGTSRVHRWRSCL